MSKPIRASTETAKRFVAYFYHNGYCLSLGASICFTSPNIEIHVPFGFFRIGWQAASTPKSPGEEMGYKFLFHAWGWH